MDFVAESFKWVLDFTWVLAWKEKCYKMETILCDNFVNEAASAQSSQTE